MFIPSTTACTCRTILGQYTSPSEILHEIIHSQKYIPYRSPSWVNSVNITVGDEHKIHMNHPFISERHVNHSLKFVAWKLHNSAVLMPWDTSTCTLIDSIAWVQIQCVFGERKSTSIQHLQLTRPWIADKHRMVCTYMITICCILVSHQELSLKFVQASSHYHYTIICQP